MINWVESGNKAAYYIMYHAFFTLTAHPDSHNMVIAVDKQADCIPLLDELTMHWLHAITWSAQLTTLKA